MKDTQTVHQYAAKGDIEGLSALLDDNAELVFSKDDEGDTPLHCAAFAVHRGAAELLIAKGALVNAKDNDGYTPLRAAAQNGQRDLAALLVAKGADAGALDEQGKTPLDLAPAASRSELRRLLHPQKSEPSKLPLIFVLCALAMPLLALRMSAGEPEPFLFVYFHDGIVNGFSPSTLEYALFRPIFGYELARQLNFLDISNPTPFTLTVGLLAVAWIAKLLLRPKKGGRS